MSFLGSYFTYDGVTSHDFGLRLVSINGNLNEVPSGSNIETFTTSVIRNPQKLLLGVKGEQVLEFQVEIVSEKAVDLPTFLRIKQWLFGKIGYRKLQIEEEWYSDFYFNCIFKANEDIKFGGEFFGVRCTVECDSPYAYTYPMTQEYLSDGSVSMDIEFDNFSAEMYGLKPIIEFKLSSSGSNFAIDNKTTNRAFEMKDLEPEEVIKVDNKNQIITSSIGLNRFKNLSKGLIVWDYSLDKEERYCGYFYLTHGVNKLEVLGYFEYLKITYQNAVRLGGG